MPVDRQANLWLIACMSLGGRKAWRSIAAALALLSVLLHATLVPWHAGSRQAARFALAGLMADLAVVLCHGGSPSSAAGRVAVAPRGGGESDRNQDCLVCKGLAAAALAIVPVPADPPLPQAMKLARLRPAAGTAAGSLGIEPRSRGPPGLA